MKIETDRAGRRIYKFSHSVRQGGHLYAHKSNDSIKEKTRLKEALRQTAEKQGFIEPTVKVYYNIFFIFFMIPPSMAPIKAISAIQESMAGFGDWKDEYVWTGVYDLQERFLREDLKKMGFDYDQG